MSDDAPDTMTPQQQAAVDAALAVCNLDETSPAYDAIVDPSGTAVEQARIAHAVSACMLLAAWLLGWRGAFVSDTIQRILAALWGVARRIPTLENIVAQGTQIWWQANPATGAEEHVDACVVRVTRTLMYAATLVCVAAGQRVTQSDVDGEGAELARSFGLTPFPAEALGRRCIKLVVREVSYEGGGWLDSGDKRRVRGVLDAA